MIFSEVGQGLGQESRIVSTAQKRNDEDSTVKFLEKRPFIRTREKGRIIHQKQYTFTAVLFVLFIFNRRGNVSSPGVPFCQREHKKKKTTNKISATIGSGEGMKIEERSTL
jgi:hypothetical protein